jgi:hypothetical protein
MQQDQPVAVMPCNVRAEANTSKSHLIHQCVLCSEALFPAGSTMNGAPITSAFLAL